MLRTRGLSLFVVRRGSALNTWVRTAFKRPDTPDPEPELWDKVRKKGSYPEKEKFPGEFNVERPRGKIYDKKPFKMTLEAGKRYSWCTCGHSKGQPLCDGSHKRLDGTSFVKTVAKFRPQRFTVEETKDYWLCNCKQSGNQPFCDGTHARQDIQDAIKS